jgi:ABC-type sugar transport system ATPase subunit
MRGEMKRIFSQLNVPVVYVTHDYREALSIGDKIIVLNHGQLVQFGTGDDIYNRMNNMFVAKIAGDPPMNFIDGTLQIDGEGEQITLPETEIRFHDSQDVLNTWNGETVTLGLRPHSLQILKAPAENSLQATILAIEPISSNYEITAQLTTGQFFKIKSSRNYQALLDKTVWLQIDPDRMHIFIPEGDAIYHGRGL